MVDQTAMTMTCARCGKSFSTTVSAHARYCSQACKQAAYRARRQDVARAFAQQNGLTLSSGRKMVKLLTPEAAAVALESAGWTFDDAISQWVKHQQ